MKFQLNKLLIVFSLILIMGSFLSASDLIITFSNEPIADNDLTTVANIYLEPDGNKTLAYWIADRYDLNLNVEYKGGTTPTISSKAEKIDENNYSFNISFEDDDFVGEALVKANLSKHSGTTSFKGESGLEIDTQNPSVTNLDFIYSVNDSNEFDFNLVVTFNESIAIDKGHFDIKFSNLIESNLPVGDGIWDDQNKTFNFNNSNSLSSPLKVEKEGGLNISIDGVVDSASNSQISYLETFKIEYIPRITSISYIENPTITDIALNQAIKIEYNIDMDTSVEPVLKFYKKAMRSSTVKFEPIDSNYKNVSVTWENKRTVTIQSQFSNNEDANETAMIEVTSAKSQSGVLQEKFGVSETDKFEIDTISPIPLIVLSPANISFANKIQTITLTYNNKMNTLVNPEIKYNYKDINYDLNSDNGVWDSSNKIFTLEFTYPENLIGNYIMIAPKDGAEDSEGRSSLVSKTKDNSIDTIPIVVTPTSTGGGRIINNIPEPVVVEEPEVIPEVEVEEETPTVTPTPQTPEVVTENPQVVDEPVLVVEEPQNEPTGTTPLTGFATFFNKKATTVGLVIILLALLGYVVYRFTTKVNVKKEKKKR